MPGPRWDLSFLSSCNDSVLVACVLEVAQGRSYVSRSVPLQNHSLRSTGMYQEHCALEPTGGSRREAGALGVTWREAGTGGAEEVNTEASPGGSCGLGVCVNGHRAWVLYLMW
jgi:hypothetical protein